MGKIRAHVIFTYCLDALYYEFNSRALVQVISYSKLVFDFRKNSFYRVQLGSSYDIVDSLIKVVLEKFNNLKVNIRAL